MKKMVVILMSVFCLIGQGENLLANVMEKGHKPGKWTMDYDSALSYAKKSKKAILLNFTGSDWCYWCQLMDRQVFADPVWQQFAADKLALVTLDFPRNKSIVPAAYQTRNNTLKTKFRVTGYPTYVLLDSDGKTEIGRLRADRNKNGTTFSDEVSGMILATINPLEGLTDNLGTNKGSSNELHEALADFLQLSSAARADQAASVFKILNQALTADPVTFSLVDGKAVAALVPHLSSGDLSTLKKHLDAAQRIGMPTDTFHAALDAQADQLNGDLSAVKKYISFYKSIGRSDRAKKLTPEMEDLLAMKSLEEIQPWMAEVRQAGARANMMMTFHLLSLELTEAERRSQVRNLSKYLSLMNDEQTEQWYDMTLSDETLLAALKKEIESGVKGVLKSKNIQQRSQSLIANMKLINRIMESEEDPKLAQLALRQWQMEFANSLSKYQMRAPAKPTSSRNVRISSSSRNSKSKKPAVGNIAFEVLVDNTPSIKTLALLSKQDVALYKFQLVTARIKQKEYDPANLKLLLAYKDQYPKTIAKYCGELYSDWGRQANPNKFATKNPRGGAPTGIPLTRARQVRNLQQCRDMFKMIGAAEIEVDPKKQIFAFLSCFSRAEIISENETKVVFGDYSVLDDKTVAELARHIMSSIQSNWKDPKTNAQIQAAYVTNRSQQQILDEVVKGYECVHNLVAGRLATSPDNLDLTVLMASTLFDRAEYAKSQKMIDMKEYTRLRDSAFDHYKKSVSLYEKQLATGAEFTIDPFVKWFSAILGASNLNSLEVSIVLSNTHLGELRKALFGMNDEWRDKHVVAFGKWVDSSWPRLQPHVKLNFMEAAQEILGDHPAVEGMNTQIAKLQEVLTEIRVKAAVDGATDVGQSEFGLFLSILHTSEIEREASGFGRFVRNGVRVMGMRTPMDYRSALAKNIRSAYKDKFEVTGITWSEESVHSQHSKDSEGWRETPLAYVKMKAKDAAVDKIPEVKVDMDFNDGKGKIVIPVKSNVVLVNSTQAAPARPYKEAELELVLDSRGAKEGKITLEVKATGEGLLPNITAMLKPDGKYTLVGAEEASNTVVRLEQRGDEVIPHCELAADLKVQWAGGTGANEKFIFPEIGGAFKDMKVSYKRYQDADIVPADQVTYLISPSSKINWTLIVGILFLAAVIYMIYRGLKNASTGETKVVEAQFKRPSEANAMSVLNFLNQIRVSSHPEAGHAELATDIQKLEKAYFSKESSSDLKPSEILDRWFKKVS